MQFLFLRAFHFIIIYTSPQGMPCDAGPGIFIKYKYFRDGDE
jgi:hypothetical protein